MTPRKRKSTTQPDSDVAGEHLGSPVLVDLDMVMQVLRVRRVLDTYALSESVPLRLFPFIPFTGPALSFAAIMANADGRAVTDYKIYTNADGRAWADRRH
jgi:hypothetical protein